jgi:hypothetical protein
MRNLDTVRFTKKLDRRHVRPYAITKVINTETYRLELPESIKADKSFHVSLLQRAVDPARQPFPGQNEEAPRPVKIEPTDGATEKEWIVEAIVDHKVRFVAGRVPKGKKRQSWLVYRVKWKGTDDYTWQSEDDL